MRNFLIGAACAAAAFGATLSQASAAIIDYYISGDGTGALNGVDWSGDFLITIAGDNSTVSGNEINPVVSVTITFLETELRPCLFRRDLESTMATLPSFSAG